ncbi:MAG: protein kinase [Acidobacteriia bacterium]|nr:protein kinase [Terriglobia bacterium]
MALTAGARLGPYEIQGSIGAGGMGEVYRALDTRLSRAVAIKILPSDFSADASRLQRFAQEAQLLSTLNHPNIMAVYDVGEQDGIPYLVSELLEGETLRERMERAPLPLRKAAEYAVQMAHGLAAAHEKGIIHRDLKPENVFITTDGRIKVLDFGLAKGTRHGAAAAGDATQATVASQPGLVLGTVGYMSPEQVRGKPADARSDLFSFGTVLYEMICGQRAFHGDSSVEVMNSILKEDPPELATAERKVPPALERIIRRCLEKNPEERFQSARDVAFALEAISGTSESSSAQPALTAVVPGRWRKFAMVSALLAIACALSYVVGSRTSSTPVAENVTFRLLTFRPQAIFRVAFAPDKKAIIFSSATMGNVPEIFTLSPEYPEPHSLGLHDVQLLSVSSKGEIALLTKARYVGHRLFSGTLARMPIGGGAPREILEGVREADFAPDGSDLAIIRDVGGKDRLEYPISHVLVEYGGYLSDLRFSPKGDKIAYMLHPFRYDDRGGVAVVDLAGNAKVLSDGYWGVEGLAWSRSGDEVLFSGGRSYSSFVVRGVTLSGKTRVVRDSAGGLTIHDISDDGRWLVTRDDIHREVFGNGPDVKGEISLAFLDYTQPIALTPDGRTLLMTEESGIFGDFYSVCIRQTDGSPVVRLGEGWAADLSPDGKWALALIARSPDELFLYPTGAGLAKKLSLGAVKDVSTAYWFADGQRILLCGTEAGHGSRCYVHDLTAGPPRAVTPETTTDGIPSKDGKLVLAQDSDGRWIELPVAGGQPHPVTSLKAGDGVLRWPGTQWVLVRGPKSDLPVRVERVDLETGNRTLVRQFAPADLTGTMSSQSVAITDDAKWYAYSILKQNSTLFVIEPTK